ncbi:UNVERIFIED_ORG: hypothetical protein J2W85_001061, partial [Ensifer adhaerens]|nr:hypothetical protein [Ensifer adhaerens]
TAPPPAHYGAVEGALASGFATAELHHLWGHDRRMNVHEPFVVDATMHGKETTGST